MPVEVASFLIPRVGADYFLLEDIHLRGGMRCVETMQDLYDTLPDKIKLGSLAYVQDEDKNYQYRRAFNGEGYDEDWFPFPPPASSGLQRRFVVENMEFEGYVDESDSANDNLPDIMFIGTEKLREILGGEDFLNQQGTWLSTAHVVANLQIAMHDHDGQILYTNGVFDLVYHNMEWRAGVKSGDHGWLGGPSSLPMSEGRSVNAGPIVDSVELDINEAGFRIRAVRPYYASWRPERFVVNGYIDFSTQLHFAA